MSTSFMTETDSAATGTSRGPRGVENPTSMVGTAVKIGGEIHCEQDLFIDGEVNGTMFVPKHKLTIGPSARVKADIKAHNVVIAGSVEGKIEASERIELRNRCRITGDIRSPRVMIEDGALVKGTVEVTRQAPRG
jgi:cytoskeletal protein CcmA (bactofilin family)